MTDSEAEKQAIRAVWQRAIDALEACDWPAYSGLWAHEPWVQAMHAGTGSWWTGWTEVGGRYRKIIEKGVPIRGSTSRMDIQVSPGADVAWAAMETEIRTGATGRRKAWQVVVFQKLEGEWRMVLAFDAPRRGKK